jgi:hypothetical protein
MEPMTITAFRSAKSPGGPHDFFSQADFWPNPKNPDGPYINRDGQSNPENFNDHRRVMIDLSIRMPALTAAWLLTKDRCNARRAGEYLRAWFVTPETRMNPNLEYSQGVHGQSTGRNYGIIDTLHLVEVARAASFLGAEALSAADIESVKRWFRDYLDWHNRWYGDGRHRRGHPGCDGDSKKPRYRRRAHRYDRQYGGVHSSQPADRPLLRHYYPWRLRFSIRLPTPKSR